MSCSSCSSCSSSNDVPRGSIPAFVTYAFERAVKAQKVQWPDRVLQPIVDVVKTLCYELSTPISSNQISFQQPTLSSIRRAPESFAYGHGGKDSKYKKMKKETGKMKTWEVEVSVMSNLSFKFKVFFEKNSNELCFRSQVVHLNYFIGGTTTEGQWSKMSADGMIRYLTNLNYLR